MPEIFIARGLAPGPNHRRLFHGGGRASKQRRRSQREWLQHLESLEVHSLRQAMAFFASLVTNDIQRIGEPGRLATRLRRNDPR
jgi:hypothetical protein